MHGAMVAALRGKGGKALRFKLDGTVGHPPLGHTPLGGGGLGGGGGEQLCGGDAQSRGARLVRVRG